LNSGLEGLAGLFTREDPAFYRPNGLTVSRAFRDGLFVLALTAVLGYTANLLLHSRWVIIGLSAAGVYLALNCFIIGKAIYDPMAFVEYHRIMDAGAKEGEESRVIARSWKLARTSPIACRDGYICKKAFRGGSLSRITKRYVLIYARYPNNIGAVLAISPLLGILISRKVKTGIGSIMRGIFKTADAARANLKNMSIAAVNNAKAAVTFIVNIPTLIRNLPVYARSAYLAFVKGSINIKEGLKKKFKKFTTVKKSGKPSKSDSARSGSAYPATMVVIDQPDRAAKLSERKKIIELLGGQIALKGQKVTIVISPSLGNPAQVKKAHGRMYLYVSPAILEGPLSQLKVIFAGHELFHILYPQKSDEEIKLLTIKYLIKRNLLGSHIKFLEYNLISLNPDVDWMQMLQKRWESKIIRLISGLRIDNFVELDSRKGFGLFRPIKNVVEDPAASRYLVLKLSRKGVKSIFFDKIEISENNERDDSGDPARTADGLPLSRDEAARVAGIIALLNSNGSTAALSVDELFNKLQITGSIRANILRFILKYAVRANLLTGPPVLLSGLKITRLILGSAYRSNGAKYIYIADYLLDNPIELGRTVMHEIGASLDE
jgi:hypothetical protein